MCGRIVITRSADALRRLFGVINKSIDLVPSWNVTPTQTVPVIRWHRATGERRLDTLRWGFIPGWTLDLKTAKRPINARAEGAASSAMFGGALASRRCIVPADAFYEWHATSAGKQPYVISRTDRQPLAFAGLWDGWRSPDGQTWRSFAILTIGATGAMRQVHDRMPVILEPSAWPTWLGEVPGDHVALMCPAADEVLTLRPVSRAVNDVRNNGPELLEPIDDPMVPATKQGQGALLPWPCLVGSASKAAGVVHD